MQSTGILFSFPMLTNEKGSLRFRYRAILSLLHEMQLWIGILPKKKNYGSEGVKVKSVNFSSQWSDKKKF